MIRILLLLLATILPGAARADAADAVAGKTIFNRCKICHTLDAGAGNRVGPNLHGVIGRQAGTADGFAYSEAMKSSGITWDEDTLAKYLHDPKSFVPGNKMAFPGIPDPAQLADLLAYLKEAAQ